MLLSLLNSLLLTILTFILSFHKDLTTQFFRFVEKSDLIYSGRKLNRFYSKRNTTTKTIYGVFHNADGTFHFFFALGSEDYEILEEPKIIHTAEELTELVEKYV